MNLLNFIPEIIYKIKNFNLKQYPYTHSVEENFLPIELFNLVEKNFPVQDKLKSLTQLNGTSIKNNKHPYASRKCINIHDNNHLNTLEKTKKEFWYNFYNLFNSTPIIHAFIGNNLSYLNKRYPNGYENLLLISKTQVINDQKNYSLGPHTDHYGKLFTMLIYISSNEDPNIGTSVYTKKPNVIIPDQDKHKHFTYQDFDKVYTSKFVKNNTFSFYRTDNSFHGVETINKPVQRKLIQYSIWDQSILKQSA